MKYRKLGHTDIKVSVICLGTMTWGQQNSEAEAHEQLDYALSQGVNFIDTAEMYPVPPMQETQGRTEQYIGSWLKARGNRDKVVLASKVSGRANWLPWIRGGPRLSRRHIHEAIDGSLRRLQTDYLDLYQLHFPDRSTNYFGELGYQHKPQDDDIAIEETLSAMAELVKAGKVRHVGISNETPWGLMEYLRASLVVQGPRIVSIQNPYSLLNRSFEVGLAECAIREQVGLLAYSPLGFGVLSGKYLNNNWPANARLTLYKRFSRYTSERANSAVKAYVELARQHGLDPAQMALAYVNTREFLTANIIGATTMQQLRSNIASMDLELSETVIRGIESIHLQNPNPSP